MAGMGSTIGEQLTPAQREWQESLARTRAELRARVTAMPVDHEVLPPDLSWDEYAALVR